MADTLTAPDQTTEQPSPELDSTKGGDSSTLESLVGDWDKPAPDEAKPEATAKPDAKPDPKAEKPAPEAKPDASKPAPKLFQAHESLKKEHKTVVTERDQLRAKVKELESRKPEGVDTKEYESVKTERERLSAELREAAYERSDEFRKEFVERRTQLYKDAVSDISSLTVATRRVDPDTQEEVVDERAATEADFRRIYFLPPREQDKAIAEMFGASAPRVHRHLDELIRNQRESESALKRAREDADGRTKKSQEQMKQMKATYDQTSEAVTKELEEKWPSLFRVPPADGDNADAELATAHTKGLALVDDYTAKASEMAIEERATHSALIRARAGAWPRQQVELRRALEKVKALEARLKGNEASDPGAGGDGKPTGGAPNADDGIEGMAAVWDKR